MNLLRTISLATLVIAASSAAAVRAAESDPQTQALALLTRCDGAFFTVLAREPSPFGSAIELTRSGTVATPAVPNPWVESGRVQRFPTPIHVEGLKLTAWRNEARIEPGVGAFFWWGFEVDGTPSQVAAAVNRLLPLDRPLALRDGAWS
jgi:hypothetical protein